MLTIIDNSEKFQKIPKESPKNSPVIENIQFPTSHLEAENPFGFVYNKESLSLTTVKGLKIFLYVLTKENV